MLNEKLTYHWVLAFSVCALFASGLQAEEKELAQWRRMDDCKLVENPANDGDSFHVRGGGKEYIFRLCFTDACETSMAYPHRVGDQAAYFGVSSARALELGDEAEVFAAKFLKDGFTIYTKFVDARGHSRMHRYFAFVEVDGVKLSQRLVEEGLVRVYGYITDLPDGTNRWAWRKQLRAAEAVAKKSKRGGWGPQKQESGKP